MLGWLILAVFVVILVALLMMMLRPVPHVEGRHREVDATVHATTAGPPLESKC
jgi:hypothetical protein